MTANGKGACTLLAECCLPHEDKKRGSPCNDDTSNGQAQIASQDVYARLADTITGNTTRQKMDFITYKNRNTVSQTKQKCI